MAVRVYMHWKGDKAVYTGKSEILHGAVCYELELLEGHRKGALIGTYREPANPINFTEEI